MKAFVHILHTLIGPFLLRPRRGQSVSSRRWSAAEPTEQNPTRGCRGPGGADHDDFSRCKDGYGYGPILGGQPLLALRTFRACHLIRNFTGCGHCEVARRSLSITAPKIRLTGITVSDMRQPGQRAANASSGRVNSVQGRHSIGYTGCSLASVCTNPASYASL
jgi:hypothetical protein